MNVAKPSLSQPCDQSRHVTRSPNHWWASSWAMRSSLVMSSAARSSSRMCSYIVVAVVFSMPPKMKSLTTTWAYLFHGYGDAEQLGEPRRSSPASARRCASPSSSRPFGTRYVSGTSPRTVSRVRTSLTARRLDLGELAGDERDEVARVRLVHLPVEDLALATLLASDERAVRERVDQPRGTRTRELGRHLDVRLVVAREEVARVLVLALRPHLARARRARARRRRGSRGPCVASPSR